MQLTPVYKRIGQTIKICKIAELKGANKMQLLKQPRKDIFKNFLSPIIKFSKGIQYWFQYMDTFHSKCCAVLSSEI